MCAATNTLLIEGSFEELCDELAVFLDGLSSAQGQQSTVQADVQPLLQQDKKDDALKRIVTASPALNSAPERGTVKPEAIRQHNNLPPRLEEKPRQS